MLCQLVLAVALVGDVQWYCSPGDDCQEEIIKQIEQAHSIEQLFFCKRCESLMGWVSWFPG